MHRLIQRYHPITAFPFLRSEGYTELLPCKALAPYVRCLWGSTGPIAQDHDDSPTLVIPDTCMDLIFHVDHAMGRVEATLCTLDERSTFGSDHPQYHASTDLISTFAIRFYAWTAACFTPEPFSGCKNGAYPAEAFFAELCAELVPMLSVPRSLAERARLTQDILLRYLRPERIRPEMLSAMDFILSTSGRAKLSDLCMHTAMSARSLERLFTRTTGLSPKSLSTLIRYQMLWQEMVFGKAFCVQDAVEKYGYFDQAHLLHDFHSRHRLTPMEALRLAGKTP